MLAYPALFEPAGKGFVITFPAIPEAISEGESAEEAMAYAIDALQTVLSEYMNRRRDIPQPRRVHGKNVRSVHLPALSEARIGLYRAMRSKSVRKAEQARRIGCQKP